MMMKILFEIILGIIVLLGIIFIVIIIERMAKAISEFSKYEDLIANDDSCFFIGYQPEGMER